MAADPAPERDAHGIEHAIAEAAARHRALVIPTLHRVDAAEVVAEQLGLLASHLLVAAADLEHDQVAEIAAAGDEAGGLRRRVAQRDRSRRRGEHGDTEKRDSRAT